jgi:hypothetical protein
MSANDPATLTVTDEFMQYSSAPLDNLKVRTDIMPLLLSY